MSQLETLRELMPWLWPKDNPGVRLRVALALASLMLAKAVTVAVPFFYKHAVDLLSEQGAPRSVLVAVFMVIAYGVGRILMVAFAQLRDWLFAEVGQGAVRRRR